VSKLSWFSHENSLVSWVWRMW